MKKIKFIALFVCGAMLLSWGCAALLVREARRVPVSTPVLAGIADGYYIGEYSLPPVYVQVEVKAEDGRIVEIRILRHDCGLGRPAEAIVQTVLAQQSLELDGVSGATVSSKCILKAIEDALKKGENP